MLILQIKTSGHRNTTIVVVVRKSAFYFSAAALFLFGLGRGIWRSIFERKWRGKTRFRAIKLQEWGGYNYSTNTHSWQTSDCLSFRRCVNHWTGRENKSKERRSFFEKQLWFAGCSWSLCFLKKISDFFFPSKIKIFGYLYWFVPVEVISDNLQLQGMSMRKTDATLDTVLSFRRIGSQKTHSTSDCSKKSHDKMNCYFQHMLPLVFLKDAIQFLVKFLCVSSQWKWAKMQTGSFHSQQPTWLMLVRGALSFSSIPQMPPFPTWKG